MLVFKTSAFNRSATSPNFHATARLSIPDRGAAKCIDSSLWSSPFGGLRSPSNRLRRLVNRSATSPWSGCATAHCAR